MKLAAFFPPRVERSVEIYAEQILCGLVEMGYEVRRFGPREAVPTDADVVWDPAATGARAPYPLFRTLTKPAVITVHGAAPLALPAHEYYPNRWKAFTGWTRHQLRKLAWRRFAGRFHIITVSCYAKRELETHLALDARAIVPIYHGVDHAIFHPGDSPLSTEPFFFYAGIYQPIKNIDRLFAAYRSIALPTPVGLTVVCPGYPRSMRRAETGVDWVPGRLSHEQLSAYYRRALAFLFPSLRESFGMPILEAMASGCPVLTSRGSACEEVAGDAALLVDPRSVDEIRSAMVRLATDAELRAELRRRGLARARHFSWERSARSHGAVFQQALEGGA